MADSKIVYEGIEKKENINLSVLVPNIKGYLKARELKVNEVAVFTSATEGFSEKNINCSIGESIERFKVIISESQIDNAKVRGYISCIYKCPVDGFVKPDNVYKVVDKLLEIGCYEISLGDTLGIGTPRQTEELLSLLVKNIDQKYLACHFHDTYGQALANILKALEFGIATFDSSVSGLGGCPYARGATGNVATEDVVYMLENLGYSTGIDMDALLKTSKFITEEMGLKNNSKVSKALLSSSYG
jgi:hydroxymethylglutaryl-CoA lyase